MNNRQTSGRRRGRNNNNSRNNNSRNNNRSGGIDRDNRIDSRARGNAAQMLDKFKKMAQDAHVNDDRVNEEYYHQFADHYFRVNADFQARKEEQRLAREGGREGNREEPRSSNDDRDNRQTGDSRNQHDSRNQKVADNESRDEVQEEKKPVRSRRPRKTEAAPSDAKTNGDASDTGGLDASALPPSISIASDDKVTEEVVVEKKPARKRRVVKAKPVEEGDAA